MARGIILAAVWLLFATAASAQNTVQLDQAMETCRRHETISQGRIVYQAGYEECTAIEALWRAKQGGTDPSDADQATIRSILSQFVGGK